MRPLRLLLLAATAASVASASHHRLGHRHGMMERPDDEPMPCHETEEDATQDDPLDLISLLNEQFQRSSEMLQNFFSFGEAEESAPAVRIVVLKTEQDPKEMACLKALERIQEQTQLQQTTDSLLQHFRSMFDAVTVKFWDETTCEELEQDELVQQCNKVLEKEDVVLQLLQRGRTDEQVCEILNQAEELEMDVGDSSVTCKLCQSFVQMVDQALAQEVQQVQQVRELIGDLCDAMSADSMCHAFLKNYDAIVDWLKHGTDPMVVCARIAMCSDDSASGSDQVEEDNDALMIPHEDQPCAFCSHVAGVVFQVNKLLPEQLPMLKSVLGSVCQMASPASKCDEVDQNLDKIVALAQQGHDPREICGELALCASKAMEARHPTDRLRGDETCVYCDAATTVVEVIMQEAPDQMDQIREYADMICSMLGDDSPCHEYVGKLDTVIDELKKGVHPRAICKEMNYCPAAEMNGPIRDPTAHVGMMRNGRRGRHSHVGMMGPEHKEDWGMMQRGDHPPHPPHHGSCFFCSRVAMVIHHVNHTSPEKLPIVKTILTNVCQLVPSKCKCDVVDKNFDKIVELEKEGKHPHEICKSLGVCNKTRGWEEGPPSIADEMKGLVLTSQSAPGNDTQCTYCQFATTVAKIALQQYGADIRQIRTYADMICDMLGEANPCHEYVKQFDFVIDAITKGMSSKAICTELKFCTAVIADKPTAIESEETALVLSSDEYKPHDHGCAFCTHVASAIHYVNKTSPEKLPIVKTILSNVCKLATPDCKCDEVDKNFDKIVELEKEGKCPRQACKSIGLCKKTAEDAADDVSLVASASALVVASQSDYEGDSKTCFFCDYVTTLVQAAYEQDATKIQQIKQLADTACALMGDESGCRPYVAKLDYVLDALKNGTHAHAICVSMKYCAGGSLTSLSATSELAAFNPTLVTLVQDAMETAVDGCFFCTQVASVVEIAVAEDPSKISEIRQIADVICGMLPSDNQCHTLVKQFDTVVDSLQKGEQPKAICHDLKYCTKDWNPSLPKLAIPSLNAVAVNGGNTCAYCSGVVTVLKYALDQKPEQVKEMREAAGVVCQLLPSDDTCHEDLKIFDEAVTGLQAGKEPQEICQTLKFCSTGDISSSLLQPGLLDFTGADFMPSRCATCQQNTLLLASLITQPDSLATFKKEIDSVCRLIPDARECELLMKHQDVIIESLQKGDNVESICTRIEACEPVAEQEKSMSVGCLFCEYTAELLEHAKDNEKALREAKVTLETMCTILPPRARCDALAAKFDELVALMREGKSPSEACYAIALCDAAFVYPTSIIQANDEPQHGVGNVMEIQ